MAETPLTTDECLSCIFRTGCVMPRACKEFGYCGGPSIVPLAKSNDKDQFSEPVSKLDDAIDAIVSMCQFAYDHGFHELGYNPITVVRDHIQKLDREIERALQAETKAWDAGYRRGYDDGWQEGREEDNV